MTEAEFDGMRRELQRLRARVEELATARSAEIADLRHAIWALEQQLLPPPPPTNVSPPPFPVDAPEPPPPAPEPEVVVPVAAAEIPVSVKVVPLPPPPPEGSFELRFGRVWLVRLGIALLVTGLVLLGNYAYKNWIRDLPAGVRLAALYLGSLLISGSGLYLGTRETMRRFGDVLLAGGLAFFYWCTFAAHHVPRLRVIDSPVVAGVLLLGAAGVIVGVSLRRESRVTAVMGLLLASYSTVLQPLGWLSAASNTVLAVAGTAFMLRPGWALPGVASMVGTYLAFFWWQIAGGSGGRPDDPAALWFLPPVWAVFALPGVIGVSRHFDGLSEKARAFFASANNVAFFLLFSALWLEQHRTFDGYWMVPAVFGAVLFALGAAGRSRDAAGGVHLAQGLGALTLAMTLKLEGYHLALSLAGQALALSFAFRRFAGKSELTFAVIATAITLYLSLSGAGLPSEVPLWSRALVAVLLIAAAFPLRAGCDRCDAGSEKAQAARAATTLVFFAGNLLAVVVCVHHLEALWRAPVAAAVAVGWSAFTLFRDPSRRLVEAGWAALVFGFTGLLMLFQRELGTAWLPSAAVAVLALAGHRLWLSREKSKNVTQDPATSPEIFLGLTTFTLSAATFRAIDALALADKPSLVAFAVAAVGIAALGRFAMTSPILQVGAALLLPLTLKFQSDLGDTARLLLFVPTAAALGVVALSGTRSVAGGLARFAAAFAWLVAWTKLAPNAWGDVTAASGVVLAIVSVRRVSVIFAESWAFLAIGGLWLLARTGGMLPWGPMESPPFPHGGMVVAAGFVMPLLMPATDAKWKTARHFLLLVACGLLALWSSQVVVWHFDWKAAAILWTLLGFALVSAGLWQKLSAQRHAGFALLALALGKLFAVDVWDFSTFNRVAAFLALGVALVVLGFFYNRFADVLKKLFEADGA